MKKGVMNYSMTWCTNHGNTKHEQIFFSKLSLIYAYADMLRAADKDVSALTLWEVYKKFEKPAGNITGKVNNFLYG